MNPKLKDTVHFFPIEKNMFHVYDAATARHFKLGAQEVSWLRLLDGNTPPDALRGKIPLEYFDKFMGHVVRLGLLDGSGVKKKFSPLNIKVLNMNPGKLLDAAGRFAVHYRHFLQWASLPLLVLNFFALTLAVPQVERLRGTMSFSGWTVGSYLLCILVSGLVHEGSHALVARSFRVHVPRVGVMLFVLHPSFYADVSGINLLSRRDQRVMVLLAGVMGNNLLVSLLQSMGVDTETFGDPSYCTGPLTGLTS